MHKDQDDDSGISEDDAATAAAFHVSSWNELNVAMWGDWQ